MLREEIRKSIRLNFVGPKFSWHSPFISVLSFFVFLAFVFCTGTSFFAYASAEYLEGAVIEVAEAQEEIPEIIEVVELPELDNHAGVYVSMNLIINNEYRASTIEELKKRGADAIVFDVKGNYVYYPTESQTANEHGLVKPLYELPEILEKLHTAGIYTVARYIVAKDPYFSFKVADAQIRNPRSGHSIGNLWVDPGSEATLEYNREIIREIALAGIDEINLDYIRYPTDYDSRLIGLTGEEKSEHVGEFVSMAREVIDETNPDVKLGMSTFAILGWNYEQNLGGLGQDFVKFASDLDVISPMVYPSMFGSKGYYIADKNPGTREYYIVYRTLEGYKELLGPEHAHKIRPWIQGYYMNAKNIGDQIQAVYDSDLCGYMVWNAQNEYGVTYDGMDRVGMPDQCS
jgi:hypothetical protein